MKSPRPACRLVALLGIGAGVLARPVIAAAPSEAAVDQGTRQAVVERLDRMPLLFVPEEVSPNGPTGFVVRGRETSVWLRETGIAYRLQKGGDVEKEGAAGAWVVALDLVGARARQPVGEDLLPTKVSYFKGPKEQWRTGLPSYGSVVYREPWPGVDVVVSGTAGELESTFLVRPGADPGQIRLAYRGATAVRLEPDGSLVVDTPLGEIREQAPIAYQEIDGRRVEVTAAFELEEGADSGRQTYRFRLGEYYPARELVVDPVTLVYCGYIGGQGADSAAGIAVDDAGNAYVVGTTNSPEVTFPINVGPDSSYNGGQYDAFVAKVNAGGTGLDYCGYIGGSERDTGSGIAVDAAGNAYISGDTSSAESTFPVTVGPDLTFNGASDGFIAKVNAAGTGLDYCGYIGGSSADLASDIAVDDLGNAFVSGLAESSQETFPVAIGPDVTFNGDRDAFVAKVNAAGSSLDYCGYIGGDGSDAGRKIAVGASGSAYLHGSTSSTEATFPVAVGPDLTFNGSSGDLETFVAKVTNNGTALEYCGYIGRGSFSGDIAVDRLGSAYVAGFTFSDQSSFPVTVGPDLTFNSGPDASDAFVTKIKADGTGLEYCGYIGGSDSELNLSIAVDAAGNAYVTGTTVSTEATFPVREGPDLTYNGGDFDTFVARVNGAGTDLDYCGYIGGSAGDAARGIAVDEAGKAYVLGVTESDQSSFPVRVGPDITFNGDRDAFVAKVSFSATVESFIPAAAVAAGAQGAFFQTDLEINNKGESEAQVTVQWLPRGQNNSEPIESEPIELAGGQSLRYENVLNALFGLEPDSVGALKLVSSTDSVIGMSRTYNVPGAKIAGTFGQGLPAIRASEMIAGTDRRRIIFLSEDADSRANIGCVNGTREQLRIHIEIFNAEGSPLDSRAMNLAPYSNNQINRVLEDWQPVNGYVDVWAEGDDALYYCYGSMLDNLTSDPTTILPQAPSADTTFIPAAALAAGLEGAFFQTDVDLNNMGTGDLTYEFLWLPRGADNSDPVHSDPLSLAPGAGVRYANVLDEVFGLEPDEVGGLAVEASGIDLLAMSRTYNLPSAKVAGTFGQELPGVPANQMIPTGVKKRIIFMNENDDVRSNVGCQNAGLEPVTVTVELHNSDGERLGTRTMELPPLSNDQMTRVFRNHAPISAGYVDVWTDTEGALIYCYGSVLDNLTSDPTTVLPQ